MTKKSEEKQTHKLTPKARGYLLEALALALSPAEIIEHLRLEFGISVAARTIWYHSQNSRGEILELRKKFNGEIKERFPFASVCVRISELERLYHRATELEKQMTYSSDKSEGRSMLKESIELRTKILKQVTEELEPLKIGNEKPMTFIIHTDLPAFVNGPHKRKAPECGS